MNKCWGNDLTSEKYLHAQHHITNLVIQIFAWSTFYQWYSITVLNIVHHDFFGCTYLLNSFKSVCTIKSKKINLQLENETNSQIYIGRDLWNERRHPAPPEQKTLDLWVKITAPLVRSLPLADQKELRRTVSNLKPQLSVQWKCWVLLAKIVWLTKARVY